MVDPVHTYLKSVIVGGFLQIDHLHRRGIVLVRGLANACKRATVERITNGVSFQCQQLHIVGWQLQILDWLHDSQRKVRGVTETRRNRV